MRLFEEEQQEQSEDVALNEQQLHEYNELKEKAAAQTTEQTQELHRLRRQQQTDQTNFALKESKVNELSTELERLGTLVCSAGS